MGPFTVIHDGDPGRGLAAVSWRLTAQVAWNLYDLADRMRTRGWLVPAYSLPVDLADADIQRVVIRHGMSRDLADAFIEDLSRAVEALEKHPPAVPLTEPEAGSSAHTGKPAD